MKEVKKRVRDVKTEMNVQTESYNLEFTVDIDKHNRLYIPKSIVDVIGLKKGDKVTLVIRAAHKIVKGA